MKTLLSLCACAAALAFGVAGAQADPGDLDPGFGTAGIVKTDFGGVNPFEDAAAVLVQPDTKIVAFGTSSGCCGNANFALARYDSAGVLDPGFGTGGKVLTDLQPGGSLDYGTTAALQRDGKIVVAGQTYVTQFDFGLARYLPNGTLDPTFGSGGAVVTDILGNGGFDTPFDVAALKNGKIVVAGLSTALGGYDFAAARYTKKGKLDSGFGKKGVALVGIGPSSADEGHALAIDKGGKLVIAGQTDVGGNLDFAVVRLRTNGKLDASFGTKGRVVTAVDAGSDDSANGAAIQPDGKIVVVGYAGSHCALVRYTSKGALDQTFGTGGIVSPAFVGSTADSCLGVRLQPDGKIVTAGYYDDGSETHFAAARFLADGSPDPSFGSGPVAIADLGGSDEIGIGLALQADGGIVVGGTTNAGGNQDFGLVRFLGN